MYFHGKNHRTNGIENIGIKFFHGGFFEFHKDQTNSKSEDFYPNSILFMGRHFNNIETTFMEKHEMKDSLKYLGRSRGLGREV